MWKKLVLLLMVVGLSVELPVLAAENCNLKIDPEKTVRDCALKAESIQHTNGPVEVEINKSSIKISAEELKKLIKEAKEGNDILDELIKQ